MLKKMSEEPPPPALKSQQEKSDSPSPSARTKSNPVAWLKTLIRPTKPSNANNIQEALEDLIEELEDSNESDTVVENKKTLITNVLKTHDLRVSDVMVPRADIIAVEDNITIDGLRMVFKDNQFSRIPVYKENLDNIVGVLHIKDILMTLLEQREFHLPNLLREVTIASNRMPIMDLFINLREEKKHMAMVVDEHGGIDGLITINDIVEAIMGDIEDEFDNDDQPEIIEKSDGSIVVDARFETDDFEERYGVFMSAEEREDVDTIGGLAFHLAGNIPKKGEIIKHSSGVVLEILDIDKNRIKRIRIRNLFSSISSSDEV